MGRNPALKKLFTSLGLLVAIYAVGVSGYMFLEGWPFQDASYMTVITVATVGYGETRPLTPTGRWFTTALILGGMGTLLYALSSITAFVVEGELKEFLRRTRMEKVIAKLSGHFIICGGGRVGVRILKELARTGQELVVVDQNLSQVKEWGERFPKVFLLEGDATTDETLEKAGVHRARGLLAALGSDKDNLFVVLSARGMNKDLRIVTRADEETSRDKLLRAGADSVVLPHTIGGMRMASEMIRPAVVSFLDTMLREKDSTLRVEEAPVAASSHLDGRQIEEGEVSRRTGALLVAIRKPDGSFEFNPPGGREIRAGEVLVAIGNPQQIAALRKLAG
jgi:voltage-gated potassium channel